MRIGKRQDFVMAGEWFEPGQIVFARDLHPHELECQGPCPVIIPEDGLMVHAMGMYKKSLTHVPGEVVDHSRLDSDRMWHQFEYGHAQVVQVLHEGRMAWVPGVYFTAHKHQQASIAA